MTEAIALHAPLQTADGTPLKVSLRRAERLNKLRAFGLVSPLLFFLLLSFVAPIVVMMYRAIDNPEIYENLPRVSETLKQWDKAALPSEAVFAALATDMKAAQEARTVGLLGKRLNYEVPGARSKLLKTGRTIAQTEKGPWKEAFIAADPVWGDVDFWRVLERSSHKLTTFYLLSALDLRVDEKGSIAKTFADQAIFMDVYVRTLLISFLVTIATLVLGYPVAHLLATLPKRQANLLMILVLLPFSTSILVRTTAWVVLLQTNGLVNDVLMYVGLISERIQLIYNRGGTIVAMTHIQLPFTILPIYSVMKTISPAHMRAARSLGANPFYAFWRVYIPQTLPGVGAGCLLTFILCLGYYITPTLVGGPLDQMVSYFVALYTNRELNWGMASALGAMLLAVTMVFYIVFNRVVGIDKMKLG